MSVSGAFGDETRQNLLNNPSFEAIDANGVPNEWMLEKRLHPGGKGEPTLKVGTPAHGGERAVQLSFGPDLEWAYVSQTFWKILAPGEEYLLSVWLRADKPGRASIVLFAQGKHPRKGEKVLSMQRREWLDLTSEWKRYSAGALIDNAGQYIRLWCVVQLHTRGVTLSIDDAQLVHENAEPATQISLHPTHSVGCVLTKTAPVIDGRLDDTCWQRAGIAENFSNTANISEPRPSQQTKVYLLHDEDSLYVGYRCFESDLDSLRQEKTDRDATGLWGDDCVELFLVPPDSSFPGIAIVGTKYYYLLANSLGTQGDNVGLFKVDQWDGKWQARTSREEDAWTVEMKIPFREVDSRPREGAPWRVNFTRSQKRLGENSSWSPLDLKFHDPPRFGNMYFVEEPGDAALVVAAAVALQAGRVTEKWKQSLERTSIETERVLSEVGAVGDASSGVRTRLSKARGKLVSLVRELDAIAPQEALDREEELAERVAGVLDEANALANAADASIRCTGGAAFVVRWAPTITNERILPTSLVSEDGPAEELTLRACPGEYEPASFTVAPMRDVRGLAVTCSGLTSDTGVIGSSAVDIKLVECWYQAFGEPWTGGVSFQRGKVLLPELLVNDDELVRVDLVRKRNLLRVTDPKTGEVRYEDVTGENAALTEDLVIRDAETLQPVNIPAGQVRQFWVTVHVPDDARPGAYEGVLAVRSKGSGDVMLPIRLIVRPFRLAKSVVDQSMIYNGRLSGSDTPVVGSEGDKPPKTETQYAAEMRNMAAHGVTAPIIYQPSDNMDLMRRALEIRKEAGVDTDRFFYCGWGVRPADMGDSTRQVLGGLKKLAGEFGYREFYNFGPDEPTIEQVREQIAPWRFVRELGWKVYLACNALTDTTGALRQDLWNEVKHVVDLFIVGGPPNAKLAEVMHRSGIRIYSYANPQCGIEEPETYRRNYGLLLWKAGYDGAMDYAYHHGFGEHMWNDFDSADLSHPYRDHVMAYPTSEGVVDTVQWEGYREGVDDLRYLSTLLEAIGEAKKDASRAVRARESEEWLKGTDSGGDLDELREGMAARIVELAGKK